MRHHQFVHPDAPAFPSATEDGYRGMSLRTYVAIEAMKSILSNPAVPVRYTESSISSMALRQAESLLDQLEKEAEKRANQ